MEINTDKRERFITGHPLFSHSFHPAPTHQSAKSLSLCVCVCVCLYWMAFGKAFIYLPDRGGWGRWRRMQWGGWPTDECGMEEGAFSVSGIKRDEGWENRCVSGVSSVTVIVKARLDVLIRKVGGQYFIYWRHCEHFMSGRLLWAAPVSSHQNNKSKSMNELTKQVGKKKNWIQCSVWQFISASCARF